MAGGEDPRLPARGLHLRVQLLPLAVSAAVACGHALTIVTGAGNRPVRQPYVDRAPLHQLRTGRTKVANVASAITSWLPGRLPNRT